MHLEELYLLNFKNYEEGRFSFGRQINSFVGENGTGKTNLLDAIYYLCLSKSAFAATDAQSIRHGADFFMLDGQFRPRPDASTVQITCALQRGQRKVILADKKPYDRLAEHVGRFPVVLIAPDDTDLVREGSETRRRFFDNVLSQIDPDYLAALMQYNHVLKQRNGTLRLFADRGQTDHDLLDTYDAPLLQLGGQLHARRRDFLAAFVPVFQRHYAYLTDSRETVQLRYESELSLPTFAADFRRQRPRDLHTLRTHAGAHRDDFAFDLNDLALRKYGSQGQQKSFVIALKLAQFATLATHKGFRPLLLLDDIFDKLDDHRIRKLTQMIADHTFGQLFVTDARPERTERFLSELAAEVRVFPIGQSARD